METGDRFLPEKKVGLRVRDKQDRALENTDHPVEEVVAVLVFTDGTASTRLGFGGDNRQCRRAERPTTRGQQPLPRDCPDGGGRSISTIIVLEEKNPGMEGGGQ